MHVSTHARARARTCTYTHACSHARSHKHTHARTHTFSLCVHPVPTAAAQVLYLHSNAISSLHDVVKLSKLPKLTKLTLHGNPISEQRDYKLWVTAHLPNLRNLDFSAITRVERDKVQAWWRTHAKRSSQQ